MICTAELAITCNHVAKLTCTEVAIRDARTGRNGLALLRNDLHGKLWLPLRTNVGKPTCTVAANTTQKELVGARPCPWWSACQASDEAGPSRRIPYMLHATHRPRQEANDRRVLPCEEEQDNRTLLKE